jgi:hypothetical protein
VGLKLWAIELATTCSHRIVRRLEPDRTAALDQKCLLFFGWQKFPILFRQEFLAVLPTREEQVVQEHFLKQPVVRDWLQSARLRVTPSIMAELSVLHRGQATHLHFIGCESPAWAKLWAAES